MKHLKCYFRFLFALFLMFAMTESSESQIEPKKCDFDSRLLQFRGSPKKQARCLLRAVTIGGELGPPLSRLPDPLDALVGEKIRIKREAFRKFLDSSRISDDEIGGSLDLKLALTKLPDGDEIQSLYFVIHDTSTPNLLSKPFPADIDTAAWRGNNLAVWKRQPVAHVFVNRIGQSVTTADFSTPVAKGWGTKFARDVLGAEGKALQLHIELVQPRRRDPEKGGPENDRIAPEPGFTDAQYKRLALIYAAASIRRGSWLIPAFHAAVDAGIPDAHDDPQNFELAKFARELRELLVNLK